MLQRRSGSTNKTPPTWQRFLPRSISLPSVSSTDWPSAATPTTPPVPTALRAMPIPEFAARTQIEVPNESGTDVARVPFTVWPAQREVLGHMARERLLVFLKARQIGVSWL